MFSCYGELSTQVYDIDKPVGRSFGEIEFYSRHLTGLSGPILEPAVGSGRVLIPLLKAGYQVEGFDISPEMLDSCKKRLHEAG
ncbi:MAG: class I SAM-dependent methyltransferase, partial [Pseudobdellovibrionaceae bacterium]|nr:class I SAM-dependent methyltransferase [Pseudobdellovibrionaceae bacterium]